MSATSLVIGGVIAAPLGAFVVRHVLPNSMLIAVGVVLMLTNLYGIYSALA